MISLSLSALYFRMRLVSVDTIMRLAVLLALWQGGSSIYLTNLASTADLSSVCQPQESLSAYAINYNHSPLQIYQFSANRSSILQSFPIQGVSGGLSNSLCVDRTVFLVSNINATAVQAYAADI